MIFPHILRWFIWDSGQHPKMYSVCERCWKYFSSRGLFIQIKIMSVSFLNFKAMQTCLVTTKVTGNRLVSTISYNCPPYHRIDCSANPTPRNALFVRPSDFLPHRLVSLTSSCLLSLTRPMMNIRSLRCYLNHYIHGLSASGVLDVCVGHAAWAPQGRKGRSQEAQRASN